MPTGKGPDPAEFDPEFVIGEEDDENSRAGTPRPKEKAEAGESPTGNGKEGAENPKDTSPPALSPEIRARLRRLEKLEPKYTGKSSVYPRASFFLIQAQNYSAHTASPTLESVISRLSKHLSARTLL